MPVDLPITNMRRLRASFRKPLPPETPPELPSQAPSKTESSVGATIDGSPADVEPEVKVDDDTIIPSITLPPGINVTE